jgi:hypothetical protein
LLHARGVAAAIGLLLRFHRDVCFWHKADIATRSTNVPFWGYALLWSAGVVPLILCLVVKLRFGRDIGRGSKLKFG